MAETVEKLNDNEIQISEPITKVDRFDIRNLRLELDLINKQLDGARDQINVLQARKLVVQSLIQKARDVGVEVKE